MLTHITLRIPVRNSAPKTRGAGAASERVLQDISGNVSKVAGYLGFKNTKDFRSWVHSDRFWPFYNEYAEARNGDQSSESKDLAHKIKNIKASAIYDTARCAEDQGKDYTFESPDMETWDGTDYAVRVILLIIEANHDENLPVIFHPNDLAQEPYYRIWQAINGSTEFRSDPKFAQRQSRR